MARAAHRDARRSRRDHARDVARDDVRGDVVVVVVLARQSPRAVPPLRRRRDQSAPRRTPSRQSRATRVDDRGASVEREPEPVGGDGRAARERGALITTRRVER